MHVYLSTNSTYLLPSLSALPFSAYAGGLRGHLSVDEAEVEASGGGSRVVLGFARKPPNCEGKPRKRKKPNRHNFSGIRALSSDKSFETGIRALGETIRSDPSVGFDLRDSPEQ